MHSNWRIIFSSKGGGLTNDDAHRPKEPRSGDADYKCYFEQFIVMFSWHH